MFTQRFSRQFSTRIWTLRNYMIPLLSHQNLHTRKFDKIEDVAFTKISKDKSNQKCLDNYYSKTDPDTFGYNLPNHLDEKEDADDITEEEYLKNPPKQSDKLSTRSYALMIKEHLNNKEIKEAINILEIRMKENRVKPDKYIFNLLISGCAKAGFTKKAFQLFNKMKQSGLQPSGGTYTSLFNGCANAPWAQDGLNKANRLRELMLDKGYIPNVMNYNAMIKAFGRCGDVQTAYLLADEMMEKKLEIDTSTFNFLLQACASDKDFGFRHALLTWNKMRKRRITPDIYTFNTMIRCVRDCSIGDVDTMEEVITQILSNDVTKIDKNQNGDVLLLQQPVLNKNVEYIVENNSALQTTTSIVTKNDTTKQFQDGTPNLIAEVPHLGSLVSISEIQTSSDRLLLLGGFSGILEELNKYKIMPTIETFTALLEVIPSTRSAEKALITVLRKMNLKVDIDFFNILIKKRSMRFDYIGAKEVLNMIRTAKLNPDIITYGVLALGCQTKDDARELLNEMNFKEIRINIQILGAMLAQGCCQKNFSYVTEIMQITLDENIKPNESFLSHLDKFSNSCSKMMLSNHPLSKANNFKNNFNRFQKKLKIWNEEHGIDGLKLDDAIKKIKESPYQQFKEEQKQGFEEIKNIELKRKQKIKKYIKKIKMKDLSGDEALLKSKCNTKNIQNVIDM